MLQCVILDGGYHGEKLYDTEYKSCYENNFPTEPVPYQKELPVLIRQLGQLLKDQGYSVYYTRCDYIAGEDALDADSLQQSAPIHMITPSKVTELVNDMFLNGTTEYSAENACLLSFHRTLLLCPGQCGNAEIFVCQHGTPASGLAYSIMQELEAIGLHNHGIQERPSLTILRRSKIPALFITLGNLPLSSAQAKENTALIQDMAEAFARGICSFFTSSPSVL